MELEYSDKNSRRSKVYIGVGIIMALLVAATVFLALRASGLTAENAAVEMRDVVVATREIPSRKAIEEGDVSVRSMPADPSNETAFGSLDEVLGRVVGVPVATGQLMTQNLLASTTEGQTFSILEPGQDFDPNGPDLRAISVTVADANAVAGTLVAGQLVDLIVTMAINPEIGQTPEEVAAQASEFIPGPSTKVTLQAMTILARNGAIYILRADVATAEKIAELTAAGGVFTLVLRPEEDDRQAETDGSTIDTPDRRVRLPGAGAAGPRGASGRELGRAERRQGKLHLATRLLDRRRPVDHDVGRGDLVRLGGLAGQALPGRLLVHAARLRKAANRIVLLAAHDPDLVARIGEWRLEQLDCLDAGRRRPALVQLREPGSDGAANPRMQDALEVSQRAGVTEHDPPELIGVVGSKARLDLRPRIRVVVADLAGDRVGVDGGHPRLSQHPRHGGLAAADVAGQTDHLHAGSDATGSGWQCGQ